MTLTANGKSQADAHNDAFSFENEINKTNNLLTRTGESYKKEKKDCVLLSRWSWKVFQKGTDRYLLVYVYEAAKGRLLRRENVLADPTKFDMAWVKLGQRKVEEVVKQIVDNFNERLKKGLVK